MARDEQVAADCQDESIGLVELAVDDWAAEWAIQLSHQLIVTGRFVDRATVAQKPVGDDFDCYRIQTEQDVG